MESAADAYARLADAGALEIYLCKYCRYLHLGNRAGSRKKKAQPAPRSVEAKIRRTKRKLLEAVTRVAVLEANLRRLLNELGDQRGMW